MCDLKGQTGNGESITQLHYWLYVTSMWADAQEVWENEIE